MANLKVFNVDPEKILEIGRGPARPVSESKATAQALLNYMRAYVDRFWLKTDYPGHDDPQRSFAPLVIAVCANGEVVSMSATFEDDAAQSETADTLRALFSTWGVTHYVFAAEAWMSDSVAEIPIEERSDRREGVTILSANRQQEVFCRTVEMIRDWDTGLVTALRDEVLVDRQIISDVVGPFTGLLVGAPPAKDPLFMTRQMLTLPEGMRDVLPNFDFWHAEGQKILARLEAYLKDLDIESIDRQNLPAEVSAFVQETAVFVETVKEHLIQPGEEKVARKLH